MERLLAEPGRTGFDGMQQSSAKIMQVSNPPGRLTVFALPVDYRRRLCTTNLQKKLAISESIISPILLIIVTSTPIIQKFDVPNFGILQYVVIMFYLRKHVTEISLHHSYIAIWNVKSMPKISKVR